MANIDIRRNDLCALGDVDDWKATYPVGGRVTFPHHETGDDTVYTVISVFVDDQPTYHPNTNAAYYRCSALLRPVTT